MNKKAFIITIVFLLIPMLLSCTPVKRPLDKRSGFSQHVEEIEASIRSQEWTQAEQSLDQAMKSWKSLKPILQLDIDHDYINDIENNFTRLRGYVETHDLSNALATILLIQESWMDIGEM